MNSVCLPFGSLPGQNPLFVDFAHRFEAVRDFYHPPPLTQPQLGQRLERARRSCGVRRESLAVALARYNSTLHPGEALARNLKAFGSQDCVAVVTGQQVTLFGGPSYTVFKAATAVRMARRLREQGANAVPVFWLASNDSDFQEVNHTHFLSSDARLVQVTFAGQPEHSCQMAGTVPLSSIGTSLTELRSSVDFHPFSETILEDLERDYRKDRSFREAFAAWISRLFADYGLIVFDPLMDGYQESLSRFYEIAVSRRQPIIEGLVQRNQEIVAAGYDPQVWVDDHESLLFLMDGSRRYKLLWEEDRYRAREKREFSFSSEELLRLARRDPGRLGVNVLLRPILQDYLFPTAFYVGGPSEVAYFAQLNSVASHWDQEPVILPRAGFTIVNRLSQRHLKRHHITALDVIQRSTDDLTEMILRESRQGDALHQMDSVSAELRQRLEELQQVIHSFDPTVSAMLENTREKMLYQLDKVKSRFVLNHRRTAPSLQQHLDHLLNHLRPLNKLQERVISFNHFLMDRGPGFLHEIIELTDPLCFSHRLLET